MSECQECLLETLIVSLGTDSNVQVTHSDENLVPTDCSGWTVTASIVSLGATVTAIPVTYVNLPVGEVSLFFDQTTLLAADNSISPIIEILWVSGGGLQETTKLHLQVNC